MSFVVYLNGKAHDWRDWEKELKDPRIWVRRAAARHLTQHPGQAHGHIEPLVDCLGDEDATVRRWATEATANLKLAAFDALTRGLNHPKPAARENAAHLLRRLGPLAKSAAPYLLLALVDEFSVVRQAASEALIAIQGPELARQARLEIAPHLEP